MKGQVAILFFGDDPQLLGSVPLYTDETGGQELRLKIHFEKTGKNAKTANASTFVVSIEGINDRDAAEALRGTLLYINRADLPETGEDEFYYDDLIGLDVFLEDGTPVGAITAVFEGAQDRLEIKKTEGGKFEIPFVDEFVPTVDLPNKKVIITPPFGLMDL